MYLYDEIDQQLVDERVRQYRGQTQRFLAGQLSEDEFRALRLRALREHPEAFTSSWEEDARQPLLERVRRVRQRDRDVRGVLPGRPLPGTTARPACGHEPSLVRPVCTHLRALFCVQMPIPRIASEVDAQEGLGLLGFSGAAGQD